MVSGFVWNIFPLSMRFKFSARSFGNRNLEDALSLFHLEQSDFFLSNFEYRYIYIKLDYFETNSTRWNPIERCREELTKFLVAARAPSPPFLPLSPAPLSSVRARR